jgi:hypothetical protein
VPSKPVPIIVGGHSEIALRRAARIGDGWIGVLYSRPELREYLARLHELREEAGTLDRPFEVNAAINDAMPTVEVLAELEAMGVTTLMTSAWLIEGKANASLDENKRALEAFAEHYIAPHRDAS